MGLWSRLFGKKDLNTFEMTETMWGYVARGAASYKEGYENGRNARNKLQYEVTLRVDNFEDFKSPSERKAPMTGWVTCKNIYGEKLPIRNGEYGLYVIDAETNQRRITYKFDFTAKDGKEYHFSGYKVILHEPWKFDILDDQTTLYGTVTGPGGATDAQGIIHYHVETFPAMLASIRVPGDDSAVNRLKMARKFFAFVSKEISGYIREVSPFYIAEYTNLVCGGVCRSAGEDADFFFFSGAHDKGFPWGDNVSFADVGLVVASGDGWRRFALTDRALPTLVLGLSAGEYKYEGPLYEVTAGHRASFSQMHDGEPPPHLRRINARLQLRFTPHEITTRNVPFDVDRGKLDKLPKEVKKRIEESKFLEEIENRRGEFAELGYTTRIHRLTGVEGTFQLDGVDYTVDTTCTAGEGEFGRLVGFRQPALYYNYFCAVEPDAGVFRIQVRSGVLVSPGADVLTREAWQILGDVSGQVSRMDLLVENGKTAAMEWEEADRLILPREDLLSIENDHFPTATFQRRIVVLPGVGAGRALALEEDMNAIDLDPVASDQTATVASIRDLDRFRALDRVLEASGFFERLDRARSESGKSAEDFSIVVKPNFSFMYSLSDISTFTDPRLVEHLVDRVYGRGYRNIAVAEAQSTYTVFFTNRDVPTLARYIGLKGGNYRIVDLSENTEAHDYGRTLGGHPVHPAWRDADFRISFAKNKTHSYAFYTLTIKNVYGALPMKNKFKEYHCNEALGIYVPTIDFLEEFPVHFGFIDAYFSADGPFGIFADPEPNFTGTIIGGDNLVAVDWVGASKMGYDPMVSEYMRLAVGRFGKPAIELIGDHSPYPGWRNVPEIVSKAAFGIMDRNFLFGDFLYSAAATMDPFFTFTPDETGRKIARLLTKPVRKVLFEWVKGGRQELTRDDLRKLMDKDQWEYLEQLVKALYE